MLIYTGESFKSFSIALKQLGHLPDLEPLSIDKRYVSINSGLNFVINFKDFNLIKHFKTI